jgi:hypothetical protein
MFDIQTETQNENHAIISTASKMQKRHCAANAIPFSKPQERMNFQMVSSDHTSDSIYPPTEQWNPVPSAPGYFASANGEILSKRRRKPRVLTPIEADSGHLYIFVNRKKRWVHHLVIEAFGHPRPEGLQCRHLDGNPHNNRPDNLRWGTHLENVNDRWLHGTMPVPHESARTKLTTQDIPVIRDLAQKGYSSRVIARQFGTSHTTIQKIILKERWCGY